MQRCRVAEVQGWEKRSFGKLRVNSLSTFNIELPTSNIEPRCGLFSWGEDIINDKMTYIADHWDIDYNLYVSWVNLYHMVLKLLQQNILDKED